MAILRNQQSGHPRSVGHFCRCATCMSRFLEVDDIAVRLGARRHREPPPPSQGPPPRGPQQSKPPPPPPRVACAAMAGQNSSSSCAATAPAPVPPRAQCVFVAGQTAGSVVQTVQLGIMGGQATLGMLICRTSARQSATSPTGLFGPRMNRQDCTAGTGRTLDWECLRSQMQATRREAS